MGAVLSVDRVAFRYGENAVLEGVSLEVGAGCFAGLVGPNGSGKTTLLRIAAGLLKPSSGSVRLDGRVMQGLKRSEIARSLALLPQGATLPATFSAREVVMMGRTPYLGFLGREGASDLRVVNRAMESAQCLHLADRLIDELSGGERQRVLVARALAQEPGILLLDEPTSHLDMKHQLAVVELVAGLVERGMAVLGVFHDLNLAACYCHSIAVLSQGRLVAVGSPGEVLRQELLSEVFQVPLCLVQHPNGGVPVVLPPHVRNGSRAADRPVARQRRGIGD